MKRITLTVHLLFLLVGASRAQSVPLDNNNLYRLVKINPDSVHWVNSISVMPLSIFGSGLEMAYEHHIPNSYTSVRLNVGAFLNTDPGFYEEYENYSGVRAEAQVRFHLLDSEFSKEGLYVGPYAQYKYIYLDRPFNDPTRTDKFIRTTGAFGAGFILGYQERFQRRVLVDIYFGGGLVLPSDVLGANEAHIPVINPYKRGIAIHAGFGVGFLPGKRKIVR